jgi:hypothetical protein
MQNQLETQLEIYQQIIAKQNEITDLIEQLHALNPELSTVQKKTSKRFPISLEIIESLGLYAQCITEQTANDFIVHRKSKKAPITKTVMQGFLREANKAGISLEEAMKISIERNWQGFKAEWYQSTVNKPSTNKTFFDGLNSQEF